MRINKKPVEIRWFPANYLLIEGYLDGLINDMLEYNNDVVRHHKQKPEFQIKIKANSVGVSDLSIVEGLDDRFKRYDPDLI